MRNCLTGPNKAFGLCLLTLLVLAGVFDVFVARTMSVTYDEPQSVAYGERILHGESERSDPLFNSKSPILALNAIPRLVAGFLTDTSPSVSKIIESIRFARLASIVASLLLVLVICRWVYSLYGKSAAIAISILAVFSPNLIAHGTLATNDGYFALGVVWALFCFRQYLLQSTLRNAIISGGSLALAQLTKPFALYLYLIVALFLIFLTFNPIEGLPVRKDKAIIFAVVAFVCFVLVLNIGFCFDRPFTSLKSYSFESNAFVRLQHIPVVRSLPVPVPRPFLQGLDMLKYHDDSGLTYGKIYLLGELRDPLDPKFRSFKSYYAVAMFFKEPIAVQILFWIGLVWIWKNRSWKEFVTGEAVLLVAAVVLFVWFSFFRRSQLGIRNILPVIAVELVIAGAAFVGFSAKQRRVQVILVLLVVWACLSMLSYYPNELAYMNEWVIDRKESYRILVDSNLDYGQEGDLVREFLARNPDVVLDPEGPVKGRILVSVNRLVGEWHGYEPMYWLLRHQPTGRAGYGHLLFVISDH